MSPVAGCTSTTTFPSGNVAIAVYDDFGWVISQDLIAPDGVAWVIDYERTGGLVTAATTSYDDGRVLFRGFDAHEHLDLIEVYDPSGVLMDSTPYTLEHDGQRLVSSSYLDSYGELWLVEYDTCEQQEATYIDGELTASGHHTYADGCELVRWEYTWTDGTTSWSDYEEGRVVLGGYDRPSGGESWTTTWDCP